MNLIKSLKGGTDSSEGGSSSSNGQGGNNSDNSALVSLGNTSFGFNFDSEEGNSSPPNSERNGGSDSDSGKGNSEPKSNDEAKEAEKEKESNSTTKAETTNSLPQHEQASNSVSNPSSSLTQDMPPAAPSSKDPSAPAVADVTSSHNVAAEAAVSQLHSIASACINKDENKPRLDKEGSNGGYNTDDEGARGFQNDQQQPPVQPLSSSSAHPAQLRQENNEDDAEGGPLKKKKKGNDRKREERNAREKERSFRISKQINELRNLLSSGGVIVPKGTKSSVLTEAANYIRMLQQHQYRSEIDRHQLVQQIQMIGGGAHGPQAAQAIRHVAAKNGVWSLGNFGGVPPKSAMGYYQPGSGEAREIQPPADPIQQTKIEEHEYRSVFNNCAVGMAIASMGGAFIDCNSLFCQLSDYTKQEVCALTIFNLTARQDLQHAFDLISQLISPPMDAPPSGAQMPIVLRGAMNKRNDLGLGVALVKGDDGIAKFFCVTLIKNPASPFDDSKPIPATIELIQGTPSMTRQLPKDGAGLDSAPAFTTG